MGVSWTFQMRCLHLIVVVIVAASCAIYVIYSSVVQQGHALLVNVTQIPQVLKQQSIGNLNSDKLLFTNCTIQRNHSSSNSCVPQNGASGSGGVVDLTKGIPAGRIYEAGHTDVSTTICPNLGSNLTLVMIITSAPSHQQARMAIRRTWGSNYTFGSDVTMAFILGVSRNRTLNAYIDQEKHLYRDIIRGKFIDTYDNLTLKTISLLEWVDTYCSKSTYILKTDDDMFINVKRLMKFINERNPMDRSIYGRVAKLWKPIRNVKSKYYVSTQQYVSKVFPNFVTGPAYLLPTHTISSLYCAALNHTYLKLEDVFVTGIVANDLKIKRIQEFTFVNRRVKLTTCKLHSSISIHKISPKALQDAWKRLNDVTNINNKCK